MTDFCLGFIFTGWGTEQSVGALFISLALKSYLPEGIKGMVSVLACSDCSGTRGEAKVCVPRIKGLPLAKPMERGPSNPHLLGVVVQILGVSRFKPGVLNKTHQHYCLQQINYFIIYNTEKKHVLLYFFAFLTNQWSTVFTYDSLALIQSIVNTGCIYYCVDKTCFGFPSHEWISTRNTLYCHMVWHVFIFKLFLSLSLSVELLPVKDSWLIRWSFTLSLPHVASFWPLDSMIRQLHYFHLRTGRPKHFSCLARKLEKNSR